MPPLSSLPAALRRHGVTATARKAARQIRPPVPVDAEQIWYRLELGVPDRPHRALEDGFTLRRGTPDDADLVGQLPSDASVSDMDTGEIGRRLGEGAALWLVVQGDRAAFACWTFERRAPIYAAKGGGVDLPARTVLLEDSIASPDFRGRGVAPGAWSGIAERLADDGVVAMMTKVGTDNAASRRAVEKAGFREIGRMAIRRRGYRTRIRVTGTDETSGWLTALDRG